MLPASAGTVLAQFDSLAGRILLKDFAAALPSLVIGQAANRPCSAHRMRFPPNPYRSTCSIVQRLTCRRLASSRWLTPFDRSTWMYSRCRSVRLGRRPEKRPSVRAFAWPATERSLIEFRHHSLKASTIESWSRPLAVARVKVFRQGPELVFHPVQTLDHL